MRRKVFYYFKRVVRELMCLAQFLYAKALGHNAKLMDIDCANQYLKNRNTLCVVAPGSSSDELDNRDWEELGDTCDMVFINRAYKLINNDCSIVSFEPHPEQASFIKGLESIKEFSPKLFIRSNGSPKKLKSVIRAIRCSRPYVYKVLLNKELTAYDVNGSNYLNDDFLSEAVTFSRQNNRFLEMGASLLFWLNYAESLCYKNVVLIGFDFDTAYISSAAGEEVLQEEVNILNMQQLFNVADSCFIKPGSCRYYSYKVKGRLSEVLDEYPLFDR